MESSVQRLLNNLKKLGETPELLDFITEEEGHTYWLNETTDLFREKASESLKEVMGEIMADLDEWLISDTGHHHQPNRETLQRFGYRFEKGEEDDFGVLTSVIVVPLRFDNPMVVNFRILYG